MEGYSVSPNRFVGTVTSSTPSVFNFVYTRLTYSIKYSFRSNAGDALSTSYTITVTDPSTNQTTTTSGTGHNTGTFSVMYGGSYTIVYTPIEGYSGSPASPISIGNISRDNLSAQILFVPNASPVIPDFDEPL